MGRGVTAGDGAGAGAGASDDGVGALAGSAAGAGFGTGVGIEVCAGERAQPANRSAITSMPNNILLLITSAENSPFP